MKQEQVKREMRKIKKTLEIILKQEEKILNAVENDTTPDDDLIDEVSFVFVDVKEIISDIDAIIERK